jgi:enoyl-CoA hydratase/long-chain 3-hydroxyacyl-CoA dehydrogenase
LEDEVGIDVEDNIDKELRKVFGKRFDGGDINVMKELVEEGFLGRK